MNTQHIKLNVPLTFNQVIDIIKQLSPQEKAKLKEVLEENEGIPEEHQKLVMERFEKVRQNPDRLLDWDEAKKTLKT